ncbi:MAG: hypothetical protein M1816_002787 [Peltula sp. TS41687]|nr:MAG: hypothetical protein M1816_002787 [Peltula sp. TS41687]
MPNPNASMSDLDSSDIKSLARILSQPVDKFHPLGAVLSEPGFNQRLLQSRKKAVQDLIHDLPPHMRRSTFHNLRLFGPSGRTRDSTPLCETHSELNADIIRMIFCFLEIEVGMRLNTLNSNLSMLTLEQMKLVRELRTLHSLWYPPEQYSQTFFDIPPSQWAFQADRCKACILARVGADKVTLMQLRITLLARRQRHRPEPRLLRWVDGCISWKSSAQEAMTESEEQAKSLKRARRKARRYRRKGERKIARKPKSDETKLELENHQEERKPKEERYYQESILDCYASSNDGSDADVDDSSHSSQRNNRPRRSAEAQAEEYRSLLDQASSAEQRPASQTSRLTRWSDLYSPNVI